MMLKRSRLDVRCVADGTCCHPVGPLSLQQCLSRPKEGLFRLQLFTSLHVYLTLFYSDAIVISIAALYYLYSNVIPPASVERKVPYSLRDNDAFRSGSCHRGLRLCRGPLHLA